MKYSMSNRILKNFQMEEKTENQTENPQQTVEEVLKVKPIEHALLFTLSFINGLSYMDRYLFGALLPFIEDNFEIEDSLAGLLYASFAITYALFYPLIVYLAQYYRHRHFLRNSCLLWIAFSAMSGVCRNVYLFAYLRILVAACQATFAAISLQVFTKVAGRYPKQGTIWLHIYQITGHLGVGGGFALVSQLLANQVSWHYCFCIAPVLLVLNVPVLIIARVSENPLPLLNSIISDHLMWQTSIMYEIYTIPTEVLNTIGSICSAFFSCGVCLWVPLCVQRLYNTTSLHVILWYIAAIYSASSMAGMVLGILISKFCYKFSKAIDALLSGSSLFTNMLLMATALYYVASDIFLTIMLFSASHLVFFIHIPLAKEMLMYVVPPPKRIFATTLQTVFVQLFGDAASAISVGILSSWRGNSQTTSLQHALSYIIFIQIFAALCFFWSAFFVSRDRERVSLAYPVRDRVMQPRYKRAFITVRSLSE